MNRTLIAAAALALMTIAAHAGGAVSGNTVATTTTPKPVATPRPAPPGYYYGLGNVLRPINCPTTATPSTTTSGGKTSVSFPTCTQDGSAVGTTTPGSAAAKP